MKINIADIDDYEFIQLSNSLRAISGLLFGLGANARGGICIGAEGLDFLGSATAKAADKLNELIPVNT
ncbi:MAG: hypothetical protein NC299_18405 [Lachnospiraceae bacterium]|nr:hypothetical protein [Ruminococcus sp.]MCM1277300.1 hypothetical protein [Lachnospiraceae bacterium]